MSSTLKGYVNSELLVTPGELEEQLRGSVPPLVIDLRSAEKFAQGHVLGAVHLDLFGVSLIDTQPAPLEAFLCSAFGGSPVGHKRPPCRARAISACAWGLR